MKKSAALSVFSIVSLLAIVAPPAFSEVQDRTTISEYCASRNDFGLSHGACVAYFTTHNITPHDASVCRNPSMQRLVGAANHGECMQKLGDMHR